MYRQPQPSQYTGQVQIGHSAEGKISSREDVPEEGFQGCHCAECQDPPGETQCCGDRLCAKNGLGETIHHHDDKQRDVRFKELLSLHGAPVPVHLRDTPVMEEERRQGVWTLQSWTWTFQKLPLS